MNFQNMKYRFLYLFLVPLFSCGSQNGKGTSSISQTIEVTPTFSSISKNILTPGCVSCHGGSGGYSFDSYANTMAAVVPGHSTSSPLYLSIHTGRMPKSGTAPSADQLLAIQNWIDGGAQNN